METSLTDIDDEFVGLTKDVQGNASQADPHAYKDDILFAMDVFGFQWYFGALDVLNRRTRHFLASCGPGKNQVKAFSKFKNMMRHEIQNLLHDQRNPQDAQEARMYFEFCSEARTATAARAQLEETAYLVSRGLAPTKPRSIQSPYPSPASDGDYRLAHPSSMHGTSEDYRWSSGLAHSAVCGLLSGEALAPTFAAFPAVLVPALIRVLPADDMSRRARLRTRATPPQLLYWGFSRDPGRGVAAVSLRDALEEAEGELESLLALQRPQVERDQWRYQAAQARLAQQKAQGWAGLAEAEAGCPGDMWDEPPNDYWHPLAAEAAAAEWDRFQAAALSGAGSGPG